MRVDTTGSGERKSAHSRANAGLQSKVLPGAGPGPAARPCRGDLQGAGA